MANIHGINLHYTDLEELRLDVSKILILGLSKQSLLRNQSLKARVQQSGSNDALVSIVLHGDGHDSASTVRAKDLVFGVATAGSGDNILLAVVVRVGDLNVGGVINSKDLAKVARVLSAVNTVAGEAVGGLSLEGESESSTEA